MAKIKSNNKVTLNNKIIRNDIAKLHDFIKLNKDDADSPIVWIAEIVEKLAIANYYKRYGK